MSSSSSSSLITTLTTNPTDKLASLRLISDSIAQQHQTTNKRILQHPIFLLCLTIALYLTYLLTRTLQPTDYLTFLLITLPGCIMTFLLGVAYTTHPYVDQASQMDMGFFMRRKQNETTSRTPLLLDGSISGEGKKEEEDIILVTKWKGKVIGTLVVRVVRDSRELAEYGSDGVWGVSGLGKMPVGVIRAWTVERRYRGAGVGRGLMECGMGVCRERGVRKVVVGMGGRVKWVRRYLDLINDEMEREG